MRYLRRSPRLLLLAVALAFASSSCQLLGSSARVAFATDPPGAKVVVDGEETGFVTPCRLNLDRSTSRVELRLDGYQTATRILRPTANSSTKEWDQMDMSYLTWRFPLWLPWQEFVTLYWRERALAPGNLFVRLERLAPG